MLNGIGKCLAVSWLIIANFPPKPDAPPSRYCPYALAASLGASIGCILFAMVHTIFPVWAFLLLVLHVGVVPPVLIGWAISVWRPGAKAAILTVLTYWLPIFASVLLWGILQ